MRINKITFIIAMEAEAKPIIKKFSLWEDKTFCPGLPMRSWVGEFEGTNVSIVINGKDSGNGLDFIGTEAATLATHLAIEKFQPQIIINAGTAGAFASKGAHVGEIYLSYPKVVFHDHRVDIPGWRPHGEGHFKVWDTEQLKTLGFKYGIVTTGSSLDMLPEDEKQINRLGGKLKDMEAAAVIWVASLHNIPAFCVKAVTDLVDSGKPTHEEFLENLKFATTNLAEGCFKIVRFLAYNPNIRLK